MIVVQLEIIEQDYETTVQDSGRVVVDGVVEGWEAAVGVDGETEGEGDDAAI